MSGQQCAKTGLHILNDFRSGRRIATTNRGPLDPPERLAGSDPADWNRYDTLGSTVYISDTDEIAFAEVLSSYALTLGAKHPLQKDADFMGMTLDVYMRSVSAEWGITWGPGSWPSTGATAGVSTSSPSAALAGGSTSSIRIRSRPSAAASANSCTPS